MSEKMSCPVCDAYTSSVTMALGNGDPCPYCGAPAQLMIEVMLYRKKKANAELVDRYAEQGRELAHVKRELADAHRKLRNVAAELGEE